MATIEEQFEDAQLKLRTLTERPSNDELLSIYGLFKQATEGDNSTKKPGMFDMKGQYKWQVWKDLEGTSVHDACQKYVDLVEELHNKYQHS